MGKIGIITQYYGSNNYGGLLQAYALVRFINENTDYAAEQISYIGNSKKIFDKLKCHSVSEFCTKIKSIIEILYFLLQNRRKNVKEHIEIRQKYMKKFRDEVPHSEVVTDENIDELLVKYNIFLAGSDQIWNPQMYCKQYFLQFVPSNFKKIAYAASIGSGRVERYQVERMIPPIRCIDYVSVREATAEEFLSKYLPEKKIKTVVDPVMLLDYKEWDKLTKDIEIRKPYIYMYFLGEDRENYEYAKKISKITGLPIVSVPYIHSRYNKYEKAYGDIKIDEVGPAEFVGLIKNAELVITDSFHAVSFSIIFKKKFWAFLRKSDIKLKDSRLNDILREYGLEERIYTSKKIHGKEEIIQEIQYDDIECILEKNRKESRKWLINAIRND